MKDKQAEIAALMKDFGWSKAEATREFEIGELQEKLECSYEEAADCYDADNGITKNEEQEALDAQASKVKTSKNARGEKKESKPRPPRKANDEKRKIMNWLRVMFEGFALNGEVDNVNVANIEKEITFTIGENDYSVSLICHRKKKA